MRGRLMLVVGLLVLVVALVATWALRVRHQGRDIRGSSTVEFVPSTSTRTESPRTRTPAALSWPMFGHDPQRDHAAELSGPRPPYVQVWAAGASGLIEFPPSLAYNRLFYEDGAGDVVALSAATGARAWRFRVGRCAAASPAVGRSGGGTVYAVFLQRQPCSRSSRPDGEVVAVGAGVPSVRWRRRIGPSETSPLLVGGRVIVGDWNGRVWALDAGSGKVRWTFSAGSAVKGGVASSGTRVYLGAYDGRVYALDVRTGHLLWRASAQPRLGHRGTFYSTPAVAYGRVYIGSTDGKVYSFGATSGKLRWSRHTGGYVYGSPAVWDGIVLVGSYDGRFYAFDAATGDERWSFAAGGPISGSANVIHGIVYFATLRGRTFGLDAHTGRVRWRRDSGRYSAPVSDGRRLYVVGAGSVIALRPRAH